MNLKAAYFDCDVAFMKTTVASAPVTVTDYGKKEEKDARSCF